MTPGFEFLGQCLPILLIPAFAAVILQRIATQIDIPIPTWLCVIGAMLSVPLYATARISLRRLSQHREAARMGARFAPLVLGKLPGNVDLIPKMVEYFKHGYIGDGIWELCEEYGPAWNMRVFWQDRLFTSDPQHIKIILATEFHNYVKGERLGKVMNSVLGTGVFNSDGEMWKFHRSMTKKFFTKDRISHFDIFDRHSEEVITQMKTRLRAGFAIDFQDAMSRFTLDSATEFLFGSCVDSLSAGLPYPHDAQESHTRRSNSADKFASAFSKAQYLISERERNGPLWPLREIFKTKTDEPMKVVKAYIEPIIKDAVEKQQQKSQVEEGKTNSEEVDDDETLLDHLVKLTSDPVVLRDETLNIMLAGRDTTAATLTLVVYFLSIHPEVLSCLRKEIMAKIGPTRRPTYDDFRELKYLRAVINETMRLYPVVPYNIRETVRATTWPSPDPNQKPIYLPAKAKIDYSVLVMHRRKDLWGPDADEFDPDRFLDERVKKYLLPNSFIFLPFNAGPRICLGQQFAYNEMSFMLIRLLQRFSSITLDLDAQPPHSRPPPDWALAKGRKAIERFFPKSHLTMYSEGGLWVRMKEADAVASQA